ncbi:uroporphyrinogen-III synthase [Sinomicrobium sp. M5D2P17]
MKHDNPRILSTKKLLPSQRDLLLHAGFRLIEADFIKIVYRDVDLIHVRDYIIFTSSNAVKSVLLHKNSETLKSKPSFCVGKKTAALLERNGFKVLVRKDYAKELTTEILQNYANHRFTFFCGNLRNDDLPGTLSAHHIDFNEMEAYTTYLAPRKIESRPAGILFFSPSGVESFLTENNITDEICFCIGSTTAKALIGVTKNIVIANTPEVESVIAKVAKFFKKI